MEQNLYFMQVIDDVYNSVTSNNLIYSKYNIEELQNILDEYQHILDMESKKKNRKLLYR